MKNYYFLKTLFFVGVSVSLYSVTTNWEGDGGFPYYFNLAGNWSAGVPGVGDTGVFNDATPTTPTYLNGDQTCQSFLINSPEAYIFTLGSISDAHLIFSADNAIGGMLAGTGSTASWTFDLYTGSSMTFNAASHSCTAGSSTYDLKDANTSIIFSGFNATSVSGLIKGAGFLEKQAAGTLTLSTANTYTGTTTISGGILKLDGAGGIASSASVTNDADFDIQTVTTSASVKNLGGSGTIHLGSKTLVNDVTSPCTISGVISGASGNLTKNGAETLTLSVVNTYGGDTVIGNGTLKLDVAGSIASSANVTNAGDFDIQTITSSTSVNNLGGAGTVHLGGKTLQVNATAVSAPYIAGIISGANGNFIKAGSETLILGGHNTYTGTTTIQAGTLEITSSNALGDTSQLIFNTSGGTLNCSNDMTITTPVAINDGVTGTIDTSHAVTISSVISDDAPVNHGNLTVSGSGSFTLSQDNTYTGATVISGSALKLDGSGAIEHSTSVANSTDFDIQTITDSTLVNNLYGSGTVHLGTKTLETAITSPCTISGVISGASGNLTKSGADTLTLSVANTYGGDTLISAGTLKLDGAGAIASSANVTNNSDFDIQTVTTSASVNNLSGSGTVKLGDKTLQNTVALASPCTISGVISGAGGNLTKNGDGTLTLSVVNTYGGDTTISAGTLKLDGAGAIASSANVINNADFDIQTITSSTVVNNLTGSGTVHLGDKTLQTHITSSSNIGGVISGATGNLVKTGNGTLTLGEHNTYGGSTTVQAGTLQISSGDNLGDTSQLIFNTNTGTLNCANDMTITTPVAINDGVIAALNTSHNVVVSSVISDDAPVNHGNLTVSGSGSFTLSQDNTYTGATVISGSALKLDGSGAIEHSTSVANSTDFDIQTITDSTLVNNLAGSGTVHLGTKSLETAITSPCTISGVISGASGNLTKSGNETLTLSNANTYGGITTISTGTLKLSGSGAIASSASVHNDSDFDIQSVTTSASVNNLSGIGTVHLGNKTLQNTVALASPCTISGVISGASGNFTKNGDGILTLQAGNTYGGNTLISTGTLKLDVAGSIADSASVTNNADFDIQSVTTSASVNNLSGTGTVHLGSKTLQANITSPCTISGEMSGIGGNFTKTGSEKLIISSDNTFTGTTTVQEGILNLSGSLDGSCDINGGMLEGEGTINNNVHLINGIIGPGDSIGIIHVVGGNYTQNPGTKLQIEIDQAGTSDLLAIGGTANIAGTVEVLPLGGYLVNHRYLFLQATNVTGTFDGIISDSIFHFVYDSNSATNDITHVYLVALATEFENNAKTHNQKQVAKQFDNTIIFPFNLAEITIALAEMSPEEQRDALDQLSGQQYTSLLYMAQDASQRFIRKVYYPLTKRTNCLPVCGDKINIWSSVEGGKTRQHGSPNCNGYDFKDWNWSLGLHKCINDYTTLGVAFSYEDEHVDFSLNGETQNKNFQTMIYGSYHNDLIYLNSEMIGGYSKDEVKRYAVFADFDFKNYSSPKISSFVMNNELGFNFNWQCFGIKPFAALEYGYYHRSREVEKCGHPMDLIISAKHINAFNGFLGVHLAGVSHNQFTLGCDLSWEHRFNYSRDHSGLQFEHFGQKMDITSYKKNKDIGRLSIDIAEQFTDNIQLYLVFTGEKSAHYQSLNALGGVSLKW